MVKALGVTQSLPSRECGLKYLNKAEQKVNNSHSLRGSVDWNELYLNNPIENLLVTPFAGVWIEIGTLTTTYKIDEVTPFAGVWIEIIDLITGECLAMVTPFAGVWIEIQKIYFAYYNDASLPSRECGLKYRDFWNIFEFYTVTPFAGVWIEIHSMCRLFCLLYSHSLRGSVDWNYAIECTTPHEMRHSLRGSVDWNIVL